jgi:hypothetical protein
MIVASVLGLFAGIANADTVQIAGTGPTGAYTGTVEYNFDAGGNDLFITLKNLASDTNNYITGFVFNVNGDAIAELNPDPDGTFEDLGPLTSANPYGNFEAGAAIGGDFEGGGNPTSGVAFGDERTFAFNVTGADASSLTAIDFLTELGTDGSQEAAFLVRFRGGESDKVPNEIIPLPAAAWMALSMLGALGAAKKIRRGRQG